MVLDSPGRPYVITRVLKRGTQDDQSQGLKDATCWLGKWSQGKPCLLKVEKATNAPLQPPEGHGPVTP